MNPIRPLAPCFVAHGSVVSPRDMLRALESLEMLEYTWEVDGEEVSSGKATLVKLMADPDSATLVANNCLFLNVMSFRYLDFERLDGDTWRYDLHREGERLTLITVAESGGATDQVRPTLLLEQAAEDLSSYAILDDEDDDE